ncbi:zinc finger protein 235-like [Haliotis rubra]|uniref:zinc finger protein 235-like n=1 Tax=Haliotis rubra TaxID=36100 RepID=UPI001EE55D1E|nr:zinc finger protein 235-like [Haliotis rubra]
MFSGGNACFPVVRNESSGHQKIHCSQINHSKPNRQDLQALPTQTDYLRGGFGLVPCIFGNNRETSMSQKATGIRQVTINTHGDQQQALFPTVMPVEYFGPPNYATFKAQLTQSSYGRSGASQAGASECEKSVENQHSQAVVNKTVQCDICGDVIKDLYEFRTIKCDACKKMSTHTNADLTRPHNKVYPCDMCDKTYVSQTTLKTHMRVHSGEKSFSCPFCDKMFLYEGNMKTHVRTHTGEKPFNCEVCGKSFSQSGTLKKHLRMHSGEKPFKCEFCDKTFAYSENLIPHRRVHSRERPFQCHLCEKVFSQPGSLKTHLKSQHGSDNGLPNTKPMTNGIKSEYFKAPVLDGDEEINLI